MQTTKPLKIAIFTLPLHNNYGGNLQAYALMQILKNLGHSPELLFIRAEADTFKGLLKCLIKRYLLGFLSKYKGFTFRRTSAKSLSFINEFISPKSPALTSPAALKSYFTKGGFDACILGGDQVFRPAFFSIFKDYFSLSFVSDDCLKIAYAASFGGDKFQSLGDDESHRANLAKFKAIFVRESLGVDICKSAFNLEATQVLDPVLMLEKCHYESLCANVAKSHKNTLFAYFLNPDESKIKKAKNLAKEHNLALKIISPSDDAPSTQEFLSYFRDADMVITDSFHGCVFAIIFELRFFPLANEFRGNERFSSLFALFNLNNDGELICPDYAKLNASLNELRARSLGLLSDALRKESYGNLTSS